jgi:hypothetical protein
MKRLILLAAIFCSVLAGFGQKRPIPVKTKEEILNETYCSGLFNSLHADYFDFTDDDLSNSATGVFNILDWLNGRVAGLRVYGTPNGIKIPFLRNQPAGLYLDEMPVSYDMASMLPVTDIAMIKVIKTPSIAALNSPGGVIAIYTYKGEAGEEETR